jgi:hypothetical protein
LQPETEQEKKRQKAFTDQMPGAIGSESDDE